jgi:hypothetical protein
MALTVKKNECICVNFKPINYQMINKTALWNVSIHIRDDWFAGHSNGARRSSGRPS